MMKLSIVHLKIIQVSLFIRAIVFILAFISRQIIHPSYDSSNLSKDLDWFGFGNWDAVHFQQIANHGYRVEQNFAFYPIWPIVLGTLGNSSILPLLFQLLTALVLFELTKEMSKDQGFAYKSAVLFSLSPAAIFYSAKYTEAIFAFFTITGLYFVQRQKIGFATVCFAVGSGIRSNGVLYCGYLIYPLLNYLIRDKKYVKLHDVFKKCLKILFCCLVIALPTIAFQFYGAVRFCSLENHSPPYCSSFYPNLYGYVQKRYWNVGLFNYYKFKQIPNILLGMPAIIFSLLAISKFANANPFRFLTAGLLQRNTKSSEKSFYFDEKLLPFMYHWLVLVIISLTVLHTQVSTRFLSVCPPLYWYGAYLFSSKSKLLQLLWTLWFSIYIPVGTILFCNFFPWT